GITAFPVAMSSGGGFSVAIGWVIGGVFAMVVAASLGQIASAYPTAGGLYHWASILGGRGWGWVTAWFNLAGLCTVLAAVNVGTWQFAAGALGPHLGFVPAAQPPAVVLGVQIAGVTAITVSQVLVNHRGIRLTTRLTDFSGYW